MTSIEQLQICGIRSFDPNPSNKQTVYFQKPLTVILGKNGAGKTTIIEALLNACTGAMPPGSGTEKSSFVYDPKVIGESEVKAQIRLIFTGKGGKVMQVIRSFQTNRVRHKTSFSTLDNTVAFQDTATGKVISSTYRASDVDRVVPEMLGVSPAVLEHVIFCHQEDCNWPLAPPKDVKRIFDDIFAATRYVLALDRLRENSKEFRRQQKEHEASLMALREHRDQAKELEDDIAVKEEAIRTIQSRNTNIAPELNELRRVSATLDNVDQTMESLTKEAALTEGRMEEKRESIRRVDLAAPQYSLEELQQIKSNLAHHVQQMEQEVTRKSQQQVTLESVRRTQEEGLFRARSQVQLMESDDQQHKSNCAVLRELLRDYSDHFILSEGSVDERSLARLTETTHSAVTRAHDERQEALQQSDMTINVEETRRQSILRALDAGEKEATLNQNMLTELTRRTEETEAALASLGGDAASERLARLRATVADLEQRAAAAAELQKRGANNQRRELILQELDAQSTRVARLRQQMFRQREREGGETDLSLLRQQLKERTTTLTTALTTEVMPRLASLGLEVHENASLAKVAAIVEHSRRQKSHASASIQEELATLDRRVVILDQRKSQKLEELAVAEEDISSGTAECLAVLGPDDALLNTYEEVLSAARLAAHSFIQKQQAMEAMTSCYATFVDAARKEQRCLVCRRPFANHEELEAFIHTNEERQSASPDARQALSSEVTEANARLAQLESIEGKVHSARQLRESIPLLKAAVRSLSEELEQANALREDALRRRESVEAQLERLNDLYRQLSGLHLAESEAESLKAQLARRVRQVEEMTKERQGTGDRDDAQSASPGGASELSYAGLTEVYEEATAKLHQLNVQLTEVQRMESGTGENSAERELNERRTEMLRAELTASKCDDLRQTLSLHFRDAQPLRQRLKEIEQQRVDQQQALTACEELIHRLREEHRILEQQKNAVVTEAEHRFRALDEAVKKVLDYIRAGQAVRLDQAREALREAEVAYQRCTTDLSSVSKDLADARREVEGQHRTAVELDRCLDVLEKQQSIAADEARLQEIRHTLDRLKSHKLQGVEQLLGENAHTEPLPRLRELVRMKMSELEKLQAQQEGNVEAMLLHVDHLKAQLARDKFHNVEKRYRSTFLKVQTTEIAVRDIEKYYGALEKAVQSYHHEKISQVNQIIGDLWRQTYRGSDIDTVEIRSEAEATTSTAARRSYNYRVVMKRGSSEIDMRGRCSAGQKVLASVIIRLALSEAFCCDCGILALDEPTTNLDEDNARSLAEALRALIDTRKNIKHFQLVVITHDEQFVRALGGQSLDRFYYVHKDREGAFSVIDERTFDQLFA